MILSSPCFSKNPTNSLPVTQTCSNQPAKYHTWASRLFGILVAASNGCGSHGSAARSIIRWIENCNNLVFICKWKSISQIIEKWITTQYQSPHGLWNIFRLGNFRTKPSICHWHPGWGPDSRIPRPETLPPMPRKPPNFLPGKKRLGTRGRGQQ